MKKFLLSLVLLLILATPAFAEPLHGEMYVEYDKITNGPYRVENGVKFYYLNGIFVFEPSMAMRWTAPRGDMARLNHHSVRAEVPAGFHYKGVEFTFSAYVDYMFAQNSDGIPEGLYWGNKAKASYKF